MHASYRESGRPAESGKALGLNKDCMEYKKLQTYTSSRIQPWDLIPSWMQLLLHSLVSSTNQNEGRAIQWLQLSKAFIELVGL